MAVPAIETVQYSFSVAGKKILDRVSFSVEEGEFLSIIGPNGAGKSTLLKCIMRINRGGEGDIRIRGKPLARYSQKALAREVSYVPQGEAGQFPFTVQEFVLMARYPHLSPFTSVGRGDRKVVEDALELTGTAQFADRKLGTLSGGERQKLFIAAALAQGASLMLLDEPTTFLDPRHAGEVLCLLGKLNREQGVTVVSVTHDINAASLLSSRVLALKAGKVAYLGNPCDLMCNEVLEGIFDKRFLFVAHPEGLGQMVVPEKE